MLWFSATHVYAQSNWVARANENNICTFSGTKIVRYGAGTKWTQGLYLNSVACNNATFGDPIPGTYKRCQTSGPQWTTCAKEGVV